MTPSFCLQISDIALEDYIAVKPKFAVYVPHTAGRYQKRRFRKAQCPIVERCVGVLGAAVSLPGAGSRGSRAWLAAGRHSTHLLLLLLRLQIGCLLALFPVGGLPSSLLISLFLP